MIQTKEDALTAVLLLAESISLGEKYKNHSPNQLRQEAQTLAVNAQHMATAYAELQREVCEMNQIDVGVATELSRTRGWHEGHKVLVDFTNTFIRTQRDKLEASSSLREPQDMHFSLVRDFTDGYKASLEARVEQLAFEAVSSNGGSRTFAPDAFKKGVSEALDINEYLLEELVGPRMVGFARTLPLPRRREAPKRYQRRLAEVLEKFSVSFAEASNLKASVDASRDEANAAFNTKQDELLSRSTTIKECIDMSGEFWKAALELDVEWAMYKHKHEIDPSLDVEDVYALAFPQTQGLQSL